MTSTSSVADDQRSPQGSAERPPAAVILATSQRVVEGYAEDHLVCLTSFESRSVIEWWALYLAAWGITDITIVATQAHRSCFVPPEAEVARAVARYREFTDVPVPVSAELAGLGRYVFLGRHVPVDPLAQLQEVLASIDNELLLVIDGDTLPPPVNPHQLVPTVVDAACLALGPVAPGWCRGYSVKWSPGAGQLPITGVVFDPEAGPPEDWFGESLGILGARRSRLQAATDGSHPVQGWNELHAMWANRGELSGHVHATTPLRFTTAVELAAARAQFPAWRTDLADSISDPRNTDPFLPAIPARGPDR